MVFLAIIPAKTLDSTCVAFMHSTTGILMQLIAFFVGDPPFLLI